MRCLLIDVHMNSITVLYPGPPDTQSYKVNIANSMQKIIDSELDEKMKEKRPYTREYSAMGHT